jgi:hypothetical protein
MRDPNDLLRADRDFWKHLCNQFASAMIIAGDGDIVIDEHAVSDALEAYARATGSTT